MHGLTLGKRDLTHKAAIVGTYGPVLWDVKGMPVGT